ncbi:MAG: hypothetical protein JEZ04_09440 [Spirochaetales bacterium]|nr:hypothetical protein [Spirochaetales bacterium]
MLIRKIICIAVVLLVTVLLPISGQSKATLAVLDFTTEAVSKTEMTAIVEFLSAELFNTDKFIVIDVSQRQNILSEMEFSMQGCSDETCALEIGKMLSAEMIVVGNLSKVGSRYLMSVKMLETETSKTVGTANGKFRDLDELIDGLESIAIELAGGRPSAVVIVEEPAAEPEPVEVKPIDTEKDEPRPKDETVKPRDTTPSPDGEFNIAAVVCTATGVVGLGAGGYFLFKLFTNTLPAYNAAASAYTDSPFGSDFTTLFDARQSAYDTAFADLIIGASAAGAGLILTTIGIILFMPPAEDADSLVSVVPIISDKPGIVVRVSY